LLDPALPSVYQIEVSSKCNFDCVFCLRQGAEFNQTLIDKEFFFQIIESGDLDGSYFIELQWRGEPLLHPALGEFIEGLRSRGLLVGLSTNASLLLEKSYHLRDLNFLTISLNTIDQKEFRTVSNSPFQIGEILESIHFFLDRNKSTRVDIQVLDSPCFRPIEKRLQEIEQLFGRYRLTRIRSWIDCRLGCRERPDVLCKNPFFSVSISAEGRVFPCCFDFNEELEFGSLVDSSLREIWRSEKFTLFRKLHLERSLPRLCSLCPAPSPILLHLEFLKEWTK